MAVKFRRYRGGGDPDLVATLQNGTGTTVTESGDGRTVQIDVSGGGSSGTVTSVALTVPTGLSVSGSPITSSGTLAISLTSGYAIPTTTQLTKLDGIEAGANNYTHPNHSGAVTSTGDGATALGSFTLSQLNTALSDADVATGGGTATGTNTGDQDLSSYVVGPASSTNLIIPLFDGTTGKLLRTSGLSVLFAERGLRTSHADFTIDCNGGTSADVFIDATKARLRAVDITDYWSAEDGNLSAVTDGSTRLDITDSGVRLGAANARVTTIIDDDTMATASATTLATSESIKAYADTKQAADAQLTSLAALAYTGNALKVVRVNAGETDFELATPAGGGDAVTTGTLDQFADVTQTGGATLAITSSTTLSGGTHSGTNTGDQTIALTGDVTGSGTGSFATTLATVNSNVGSFGSATAAVALTVNAKGLVTAASSATITPAVGSITGLGTGIASALAINTGSAGAPVLFNGAGGTPSSITLTNASGTAASLTAGTASAVAVGGITGMGTGVATALAVNTGSAGALVVNGGALGTPSSGTLTNCSFPTLNQNTTGTAAGLSATLAIGSGGTGLTALGTGLQVLRVNAGATALEYATLAGGGDLLAANNLSDLANAATARTNLGLAIGTNVQAYDADLTTWAGITPGTNVGTALAIAVGSAGAIVTNGGALGTPSSGTLTNATGLPISTGVSGLGTGIATFLATPSSANLRSALTDETGAGAAMFTRTGVYRQLWIGASAMVPRTTNGAAVGTAELATNDIMLDVLDFDATTEEGAGFWVNFGDQWDAGTVKVKAYWTAASGSGTVDWDFAAQSYADDDAIDQALGTEQGVTDTLITANDMHISSATAALTIADATAGEPVYFQVARDVATDTLAVDARLIGVMIQYLESATEQSAW